MNDLLSILQPEQYPVTLEIINKEIMVKPYNHGETKAFLELIDDYKKNKTGGMKKLFLAQKNLIDSCILADATGVKPIHSEQLHRADYVKLMVELKNITHGEQSIIRYRCSNPDCKDEETQQPYIQSFEFHLPEAELKNKERKDFVEIEFQNGTKIKINMKPYTFDILLANAELFEAKIPTFEMIDRFQASFIDSIEVGEIIHENKSMEEKIAFVSKLIPKYKKVIAEYIKNEPMYEWKKEWSCPVCSAKNVSIMREVQDFFV